MKRMLRRANVRYNDFLYGMSDSGHMTADLATRLVRGLPRGVTEFCFHPATRRCEEIDNTMPFYEHEQELEALTSESLRQAVEASGAERVSFCDI
jgi:hypothetical protein